MQAALIRSPGLLEVTDVADPTMPPGGALLKVLACAVCGTDVKMLQAGHRDLTYPRIPGHEVTALVKDTDDPALRKGQAVQVWPGESCGECVQCRSGRDHLCPSVRIMGFNTDGGMAEMLALADTSRLIPIGDADPVLMTLAEPLACCINAQEKLGVGEGDDVLILGGGPMGCLNAYLAKRRGARTVLVSEPQVERLKAAPKGLFDEICGTGTEELRRAVRDVCGNSGVDVIIPCTPDVRLDRDLLDLMSSGGRACVFCGPRKEDRTIPLDMREVHYRELTIVGSYGNSSRHCMEAVSMLMDGQEISWMFTGRFHLESVREAFSHASRRVGQKAVVVF